MRQFLFSATIAVCALASLAEDAALRVILPQNRTAFQTNEWVDVTVLRKAGDAGPITLNLNGAGGSKINAVFDSKRTAEHFHINGALLRPEKYSIEAASGGASAKAEFELFSHVRRSEFKLVNWGRADKPAEQLVQGEDSFGYNLFYGHYGKDGNADFIRAQCDFMGCCVQGGAHQMDMRLECDWSDPYTIRGGTQRVARQAMGDRLRGNVWGVHFYDEPGLTWNKDPGRNDEMTPHEIPAQKRSFEAAFGFPPLDYKALDPKNPEHAAQWNHWARWKLGFMDAYEKECAFGVSRVRPDFVSVTQSQYAGTAFTDGYYFNVARSMPIVSGHGGYDDYGPGIFNPSYTLELARARNWEKPNWYLPTWYGNMPADRFRLEQYLSFMTNLQGMITPPDMEPARNALMRQGIVETNHLFQQLGPIFNHMPVTKPPVAILYSLSYAIHRQTQNMDKNYLHQMPHGRALPIVYMAGKVTQYQFAFVVEEDVLDGTLMNDHKAVILTALDYIDPKVVKALEDFAANGGLVISTADTSVEVKGAVKLAMSPRMIDDEIIDKLYGEKNWKEAEQYTTTRKWMESALPVGKAIKAELMKKGIAPIFECDQPGIIASRQVSGNIEYFFAVNASFDENDTKNHALKAVEAKITLPTTSSHRYEYGHSKEFFDLSRSIRFGPGQMRVFVYAPADFKGSGLNLTGLRLHNSVTAEKPEITLNFNVGYPLGGALPLRCNITDPQGTVRHRFYRSMYDGIAKFSVPLAVNDPPGRWIVSTGELLSNSAGGAAVFEFNPPRSCPALFGATARAVSAANDRENVFHFGRTFNAVSIVKGKSAFNDAAAERLVKILKPWGVECNIVELADASKPRELSAEEARTWCGLEPGAAKLGAGNDPKLVGFALQGPVILLGNPEDNALIKFLNETRFLPYKPQSGIFPGDGRGMFAWQRDGIGKGQESVTLIAYDESGMSEAVGSMYEAVAGLEPLTKFELPVSHQISVPTAKTPEARVIPRIAASLHDRVDSFHVNNGKLVALSHDGSECTFNTDELTTFTSKVLANADYENAVKAATPQIPAELQNAMKANAKPNRMMKLALAAGERTVFAYWGGEVRIVGKDGSVVAEEMMPQDVTALAYFAEKIVIGLADGRVFTLK